MTHHSFTPIVAQALLKSAAFPTTVARAFVESIKRYSEREAIKPLSEPAMTYQMLGQEVKTAISVFDHLGIKKGDRVAIYLPNVVEWAVLTYAAALVGACVVPINIRYRADELAYGLKNADVRALFTQTSFLSNQLVERLQEVAGGPLGAGDVANIRSVPTLKHIVLIDDTAVEGAANYEALVRIAKPTADLEALAVERGSDEPMWLFWTSGTTSAPKAALLPQSAIEIVSGWTTLAGYSANDRVLSSRPLFYIAGHFWCMLGPMLHGACMVLGNLFTTEETVSLCRGEKVTVLSGNPLMFKRLIQNEAFDPTAFEHVRLGYFGGSALPVEDMKMIHSSIGFAHFMQTYGMTEFGGFIMSTLPGDSIADATASCGFPVVDIELKLVDPDSGVEVAPGEVGALLTRGQKLIQYVNLSETQATELFNDDGWYRTGDMMRLMPDGRYQLTGRAKDLIKVGGENVTAAEIESILTKRSDVSLAVVIARLDDDRGEVPVAFIESTSDAPLDTAKFLTWCRSQMAPFKVPAEVYWVKSTDWPMTSSGKVAKHELAKLLADRDRNGRNAHSPL